MNNKELQIGYWDSIEMRNRIVYSSGTVCVHEGCLLYIPAGELNVVQIPVEKVRNICVNPHPGIYCLTAADLHKVIETRKPLGLFYAFEDGKVVGVDNTGGDAWTEEFSYADACIRWLTDAGE